MQPQMPAIPWRLTLLAAVGAGGVPGPPVPAEAVLQPVRGDAVPAAAEVIVRPALDVEGDEIVAPDGDVGGEPELDGEGLAHAELGGELPAALLLLREGRGVAQLGEGGGGPELRQPVGRAGGPCAQPTALVSSGEPVAREVGSHR